MKLPLKQIIKAFRLYKLADDNTPSKAFRHVKASDNESWVKIELIYHNDRYQLFWGSLIDEEFIEEELAELDSDYQVLTNPLDSEHTITPFQGKYLAIVKLNASAMRLDMFLSSEFDASKSRSQWQKHIKAGHISVNGKLCLSPKQEVSLADTISYSAPTEKITTHDIAILYQDDDVVVFDKPVGMLTHAKGGIIKEQTVADVLRPLTTCDGERAGIVHRLDRDTSGVIITARHPEAEKWLQHQFATRQVKKTYLAITSGVPKQPEALLDLPIARNPAHPSTFRVDPKGKEAQTTYQVIDQSDHSALVRLMPKTGRTHQLRVHLAYLNTPILGDRVYGEAADRLYLHAYELTINLPSGNQKTFRSSVPGEFETLFPRANQL